MTTESSWTYQSTQILAQAAAEVNQRLACFDALQCFGVLLRLANAEIEEAELTQAGVRVDLEGTIALRYCQGNNKSGGALITISMMCSSTFSGGMPLYVSSSARVDGSMDFGVASYQGRFGPCGFVLGS